MDINQRPTGWISTLKLIPHSRGMDWARIGGWKFRLVGSDCHSSQPFPTLAGAASALLGFVQLGAAALTGTLVGGFDDGTQMPMATAIGIAGLAGLASFAVVRANRRR